METLSLLQSYYYYYYVIIIVIIMQHLTRHVSVIRMTNRRHRVV